MALPSPTSRGTDAADGALLSVRVVVRTPTVESFVEKYCRFVKDDRIFIFTKTSQPPGTRLRFTLELVDGRPLVTGEGTVTRVREDQGDPARPGGMELRFVPTDDASAKLVGLMLNEREMLSAPPTLVREHVPAAPRATLAPLPLTGANPAINSAVRAPAPSSTAAYGQVRSPLLAGPVVGAKTDLPRRPGSRPTLIGTPAVDPARVGTADPLAALTRTVALEAPVLAAAATATPKVEETKAESAQTEAPVGVEAAAADANVPAPAPRPSLLDAASLFAQAAAEAAVVGDDEKTETRSSAQVAAQVAADANDELSQSFPGLAQPTQFAESWRPAAGDSLVPANPFGEVSDTAIEYFVEWSLERSTAVGTTPPPSTNFGSIEMRPPRAEESARSNRGVGIGLVIGLGIGVVAGGILMSVLRRPPAAAASTAASTNGPGPPAPSALKGATMAIDPPTPSTSTPATKPSAPASVAKPTVAATPPPGEAPVEIVSTPPGATISIDGKERGKTPLSTSLLPGKHDVALALDRHVPFRTVLVSPGKLDAQLKRPHSTLVVSSTPAGGDVTMNGEARGKTPVSIPVAEFETYKIDVALPNGKVWHRAVYAKNATMKIKAQLSGTHATATKSRTTSKAHSQAPPVDVLDGRGIQ